MKEINLQLKIDLRAIVILVTAALAIMALYLVIFRPHSSPGPEVTQLPSSSLKSIPFAVYAPTKPPKGFVLDTSSISKNERAIVYRYTYNKDKSIIVSTQALPRDFDTGQFKPDKETQIRIGKAYVVELENRTTAAIVTDQSLLFINAPDKISLDDFMAFINSLYHAQ